jgi:UDP-GlcNAc:undecaprenyl-phosphate GlcNAc-1-phosphate transferase
VLTAVLLSAIVAAALSWTFCGLVRQIATRGGAVVPPRPDRWHSNPTPTMGGVGFALAAAVVVLGAQLLPGASLDQPHEVAVPLAALAMFVIGLLDDRLQLAPLAKLVASLVVGALVVFVIATGQGVTMPWPLTLIAVLWFGGVVHALNLLDNMDGLAGGIAMAAAALMAYLYAPVLGDAVVLFLGAIAGSMLGFLYWNRHRARLFMGDSGSLFLGGSLAAASLVPLTAPVEGFPQTAAIVGLVLAVPLFDTTFVLVLRRLAGRRATRGGTDHLSHRLVSLGFSERSSVRILYLIGLSAGVLAFLIKREGLQPMLPLALMFGVGLVLVGIYLARVRAYDAEDFRALQKSSFAPFLQDLTFKWHAGQVLLDLVLITACYYGAWRIRFDGEAFDNFAPFFAASLPIVIGSKLGALYVSGLYSRSWETFGLVDLMAVLRGVAFGSLVSILIAFYVYRVEGFSRAVFIIDAMLLFGAVVATRASFRAMGDLAHVRRKRIRRVLVYGAGASGQMLVREMRANPTWNMRPVGFLDDDPLKRGRYVMGVLVQGALEELPRVLGNHEVDEIVISSPSIDAAREHAIRRAGDAAGKSVRRLFLDIR